jgi:hypothetical protein
MKTTKVGKRLTLNKKTIANLNRDEIAAVHGGEITCGDSCDCSTIACESVKCSISPPKGSDGGTC